ncbi:16S rRNA (guanine(966)-N(2))-methyltransferase RsmD [Ruminiclostridium sufflavum DSM 19573]|uniref:16S rRNA (Guanine(966)-N(2))-methyltransferase RsmD n=1 Tax=Ruminiclostridium sufflavum DSM 19573 TaxID=1121337 RepID=A0A318XI27_9FIRM|nr:16S rRNA (guanine(966)-N(2))-methyltransferase RsmD [Ruminiclostridium sufflavum]PYG86845.1 16S rRNA (guanine(966)-N(2))-methyltransferase RsmD [Ruminiclostridium sufflavum DSM 19573]
MRVISGSARGLKLVALESMDTRPTADRVKENLFNIIAPYIDDTKVLDLYAGSGGLGIEALSRGAQSAVFCDSNDKSINIIKTNIEKAKFLDKANVFLGEAKLILKKLSHTGEKFDIIFLDPPYRKNIVPDILTELEVNRVMEDKVIIVAETDVEDSLPYETATLVVSRRQIYGKTKLTFYKHKG